MTPNFRNDLGYHQPAGALASVGVMGAGIGATQSKYVARRETPVYIAENCTQCMECITACPDTALPNTAQDLSTVLVTADPQLRHRQGAHRSLICSTRSRPSRNVAAPDGRQRHRRKGKDAVQGHLKAPRWINSRTISEKARGEFTQIIDQSPLAYNEVTAIFRNVEKKSPGNGGGLLHFRLRPLQGLRRVRAGLRRPRRPAMTRETPELNAELTTAQVFSRLLPDTSQKYLGLYNDDTPEDSREAALRNHLMVRRNYEALVSGDGACAGCGEKSMLRAVASVTEAYMRPLYHKKAERLYAKATASWKTTAWPSCSFIAQGTERGRIQAGSNAPSPTSVMGLGGENDDDTTKRLGQARRDHRPGNRRRPLRRDAAGRLQPQATCRPSTAATPTA